MLRTGLGVALLLLPACGGGGQVGPSPSPSSTAAGSASPSPSAPVVPFNVGYKNDQPNLNQLGQGQDQPKGFESTLAQVVLGGTLGLPVNFTPITASTWEDALNSRRVRVVVSAVSYTEERNKRFLFAGPYLKTGLGVLVGKDSKLVDKDLIAAAKGLKVCYQENTTAAPAVELWAARDSSVTKVPQSTSDRCLAEIGANPDEVFISDGLILRGQSIATPGKDLYRFVEYDPGSLPQKYAIALHPDDRELCQQIAKALDGYLRPPSSQWFDNFNSWFGPAWGDRARVEELYKPAGIEKSWCTPPSSQG
ncbi:transporter substrate-binding domain-containing protein [Kitasatospora sp. NPDC051853]|uniref:transporter substrate-binding domain-containing protein n=1 Tax=Kitasatospora sp. NPDC051853 TaxID=3364058 RepID=UPI003793D569